MAILSKIRDRSVILIAVIGLALFAFVLDPSTLTDFFDSSKINTVGKVDKEAISTQEYAEALDTYKARSNRGVSEMQTAGIVWENILKDKIYAKQLEKAGVTIGETDVLNAIINSPSVQRNPRFLNEVGVFDENIFLQFLKEVKESEDQNFREAWDSYINEVGTNLKRDTYDNLVKAGLGASLKEGEYTYREENDLVNADFIFIPYTSIPDSLVSITDSEISSYIKKNASEYEVEASRDISYVKFDISPTKEDKEAIRSEVGRSLKDRDGFNKATAQKMILRGLKNTTNYPVFFEENNSDLPEKEIHYMEKELPLAISREVLKGKLNDTFGPYEDNDYYKISKITAFFSRPDSVKASSILIPYLGSLAATATTTETEEQAKFSADSIYELVKLDKEKFTQVASEINTDGSKEKGGDIGWNTHDRSFNTDRFDADLAAFMFDNKPGNVGVVKSKYGYHVIRIDEQTKRQKGVSMVTFGIEITPSQETENTIFQNVEKFALDISSKESNFYDAVEENSYQSKPAIGLNIMDDRVPGLLGTQRQIITWAFGSNTKVGDSQRFDIDNGYVVAFLTNITKKGLMNSSKVTNRVKPILLKEKKAAIIHEKMTGATLNDIATANNISPQKISNMTLKSPTITGIGFEPKIIGAMYYAKEKKLYKRVDGNKGVFAFVVTKKEAAVSLPNYESFRTQLSEERKNSVVTIFESLKKCAEVEDRRARFHGVY